MYRKPLSSTSSISNGLMLPLTFLSKHEVLSQMKAVGVQKIPLSQAWLTAAFYLLNHSAALGSLPIKLKPWLVQAKNGRVVAMPPLESGSAPLCKCTLTGGNRQGWRSFCTRMNMPALHCENCGWWLMERELKPVRLHLNSVDGGSFKMCIQWKTFFPWSEVKLQLGFIWAPAKKSEVQWT